MRIAIVGSGISGLGAALALSDSHDVRVFEKETRVGGHANTVDVAFPDGSQWVDTGFIVYNAHNYPNLTSMFEHLDVPTRWSDMSFGFSLNEGSCEYACDNLSTIFAQRWRVLDPRFLRTFSEILRFARVAPKDLEEGALTGLTLGEWLDKRRFSSWFRTRFLLPMGGAIWSTNVTDIIGFPAESFVRFFVNHDLMTGLDAAQRWRTVDGGSREYVKRIMGRLGPRAVVGDAVNRVDTSGPCPRVCFADGRSEIFDHVIMATHAPTSRHLLGGTDDVVETVLSRFRTSPNVAVLHSDPALMPLRRSVWSSWNFLSNGSTADAERPAQVSYWMNRLQGIDQARPLFVSLNPQRMPDPALEHARMSYDHPLFDQASFQGQAEMDAIQGRKGVWYAGAWLGYGFHEDGLRSGLRVAEALGARPEWVKDTATPLARPLVHAAE